MVEYTIRGKFTSHSVTFAVNELWALHPERRNVMSDNNLLTGSLPSRIGDMQTLKSLQAGGIALSGTLSLSTLSKLASKMKLISLSGNNFTGSFPKWNASAMDGTGKTVGQINMVQKEGYVLTLE